MIDFKQKNKTIFIKNFLAGLSWAIGTTFGFALFLAFISLTLKWLGALPIIGNFFAGLIEATNKALRVRNLN